MNVTAGTLRYIVPVSRVSLSKAVYALYALVAVLFALWLGLNAVAPEAAKPVVIALAVVTGGVLLWCVAPRAVVLEAGPQGAFVDDRKGTVLPVAKKQVGVWDLAVYGVAAGTALHLDAGDKHLTIGGRDHRLAPTVRPEAPPTTLIDLTLSIAEFDALLVALAMPWAQHQRPGTGVTRCTLSRNRFGGRVFLDFEGWQVRVVDPATGATLAEADVRTVRAEPVEHTYTGRISITMPGLILEIPGFERLHMCTPDMRFSWSGPVRSTGSAPYVVGGPDWLALAERFGGGALVIGKGWG